MEPARNPDNIPLSFESSSRYSYQLEEEEMQGLSGVRIALQVMSIALLMGGIVATVYSVVTTRWQTLDISEFDVVHEHGLWKDCWQSTKIINGGERAPWKCTYKFNQDEVEHDGHNHASLAQKVDGEEIQHLNLKWHKVVFGLMVSGAVIGLVALLFSFCAFCAKPTALIWSALTFIAACCDAAALIVFFRCSHDKEYRFVHFHGKIYENNEKEELDILEPSLMLLMFEQEVGSSFFWGLGATLAYLVGTIAAVLCTVLLFLVSRRDHLPHKTWPKHHTAV